MHLLNVCLCTVCEIAKLQICYYKTMQMCWGLYTAQEACGGYVNLQKVNLQKVFGFDLYAVCC